MGDTDMLHTVETIEWGYSYYRVTAPLLASLTPFTPLFPVAETLHPLLFRFWPESTPVLGRCVPNSIFLLVLLLRPSAALKKNKINMCVCIYIQTQTHKSKKVSIKAFTQISQEEFWDLYFAIALLKHLTHHSSLGQSSNMLSRRLQRRKNSLCKKTRKCRGFFSVWASSETILDNLSWQACCHEKKALSLFLFVAILHPAVFKRAGLSWNLWQIAINCELTVLHSLREGEEAQAWQVLPSALPRSVLEVWKSTSLQVVKVLQITPAVTHFSPSCLSIPALCLLAPLAQRIGSFEVNDLCFLHLEGTFSRHCTYLNV